MIILRILIGNRIVKVGIYVINGEIVRRLGIVIRRD